MASTVEPVAVSEDTLEASKQNGLEAGGTVNDGDSNTEEEPVDALELALRKALAARGFEGLDGARNALLATTQLTISNVISTVVTALPLRVTTRRKSRHTPPPAPAASSSNQEQRETVYGAPKPSTQPKKGRRGSRQMQAQLPTFRRSLPALAVPVDRLHRELLLERDAFMAQLAREREEKTQLERWAATRIQACYRGFRSRPRVVAYARRLKRLAVRSVSGIRIDLVEMQESLKKREDDMSANAGDSANVIWRKGVKDRAHRKRDIKSRQEERQQAATLIQACGRKFLAKIAFAHLVARARDERYLVAVIRIQSFYRGYLLRTQIQRAVPLLRQTAALQIQTLIRGSQARERVSMRRFERKCEERRRAGLPLQFSLSTRTPGPFGVAAPNPFYADSPRSSVRCLFESRKTRASLEFRSAKWREQRLFLRIHHVAQKLVARRARLVHRWNWTKTIVLDKRRQKRVKKLVSTMSSSSSSIKTPHGGGRSGRSPHRRHGEKLGVSSPTASSLRDSPA